jgi:hypothetical protein
MRLDAGFLDLLHRLPVELAFGKRKLTDWPGIMPESWVAVAKHRLTEHRST